MPPLYTIVKHVTVSRKIIMKIFLFLFGISFFSIFKAEVSNPLVIDHDGGADDAMAIFLALIYEQNFNGPSVIAITTSHGNVDEQQVFINTQRFLTSANRREIPVYRGSSHSLISTHKSDYFFGKDGLGDAEEIIFDPIEAQPMHAAIALIELSKEYEGNLTIVVLGALTNIALAIRLDVNFLSRLKTIYFAAGHIQDDNMFKTPQYNVLMDVEAYYVVAESANPETVIMVPHSPFKVDLHSNGTYWRQEVLGKINSTLMEEMNLFERIASNLLDPSVMAMVFNDSLIEEFVCSQNSVHLCGNERGINTNNFTDCIHANIRLALPSSVDLFKNFIYSVFQTAP